MNCYENLPWMKIHDFLSEVGNERQLEALCKKALCKIDELIPYDLACVAYINEYREITFAETINLEPKWNDLYVNYYDAIDPCKKKVPEKAKTLYTDWRKYWHTEFGNDFARAVGFDFTTSIVLHNQHGRIYALLFFCRSKCSYGFSELELATLQMIQPHLTNLYINLDLLKSQKYIGNTLFEAVEECRKLTKREKEIAALLCQGINTSGISSQLFISPATVYRHVNNIFEKLNIRSRQELISKLLGLNSDR